MENYLSHHGIKGQKWGVRRFQNKDGSLTAAGKRRVSNKEIKNDLKDEYLKSYEKHYSTSKAKGYNDAADIIQKHYDLENDGTGGIPGTPSLAREQYRYYRKKAASSIDDEDIDFKASMESREKIIERYGQERVSSFDNAEILTGAAMSAAVLAAQGYLYYKAVKWVMS